MRKHRSKGGEWRPRRELEIGMDLKSASGRIDGMYVLYYEHIFCQLGYFGLCS